MTKDLKKFQSWFKKLYPNLWKDQNNESLHYRVSRTAWLANNAARRKKNMTILKNPTNSKAMLGCPFCGCSRVEIMTENKDIAHEFDPSLPEKFLTWITCYRCNAEIYSTGKTKKFSIKNASKKWNRRKPLVLR